MGEGRMREDWKKDGDEDFDNDEDGGGGELDTQIFSLPVNL